MPMVNTKPNYLSMILIFLCSQVTNVLKWYRKLLDVSKVEAERGKRKISTKKRFSITVSFISIFLSIDLSNVPQEKTGKIGGASMSHISPLQR